MKKRIILTSVLSIAMCLSLIVGATMAFFGSESKANISVTGANVNVVASIDPATGFTTYSKGIPTSEIEGKQNGEFENGGTASIDAEGALVLNAISAGDSVKVHVDIYNDSNIRIQYRARVVCEEGEEFLDLFEIENDIRHMAWQIAEIGNDLKDEIVEVTIGLPEDVNLEDFEGQTIKFAIVVEAVQANAETTDDVIVYEPEEGNTAADNGADLQNIMASGLEAGTSVYLGAGEYALQGILEIPEGVSLYGAQRGNAAVNWINGDVAEQTVIQAPASGNRTIIVESSDVVIDGITLDGSTNSNDVKAIAVSSDKDNVLTGIEVRNCAVKNFANDGISVQCTSGAVIEGNYVKTVYDSAISLENYFNEAGVTSYIRNNVVENVTGTENGAIAVRGEGGCKGNVIVSDNIVNNVKSGLTNDIASSAISVDKVEGGGVITIQNNTVSGVTQGIGIYKFSALTEDDAVVVSGNTIQDADTFGIATGTLNYSKTDAIETIEITGNTFTGKVPAKGNVYLEQTNRYNETTTDWRVIVNGVEFTDETVDENLSLISTAAELSALAATVAGGDDFQGKIVVLTDDIDLSGQTWTPINDFYGTFDGAGHTISNLTVEGNKNYAGLFGDCRKGTESGGGMHHLTIRNLTLSNAQISGNESVAAVVAASSNVTIENVTVQSSVINGQKYVGGILGYSYGNGTPSIAECKAIGVTLSIGETGGAIVGFLEHGSINDCLVQDCTLSGTENIGCVAGRFSSGDHGVVTYDNLDIVNTTINGAEAENIWGEHLGI